MLFVIGRRHQHVDVAPQHLLFGIAEEPRGPGVVMHLLKESVPLLAGDQSLEHFERIPGRPGFLVEHAAHGAGLVEVGLVSAVSFPWTFKFLWSPLVDRVGTRRQWIGSDRIDWSTELDMENPLGFPDDNIPIVGTEWWEKMNAAERGEVAAGAEDDDGTGGCGGHDGEKSSRR